jgi:sec-independent protein translocase protein TatB
MFFGLTIEKLLLIGLVAGLLIGPERLPRYVESLTKFARRAREYVTTAKTKMKDEMGSDFDDVDWRTLDPRQYDPRRIIREALLDDAPVPTVRAASAAAAVTTASALTKPQSAAMPFTAEDPPPFDNEAT